MRFLLDTHTFLWAALDDPNLSKNAADFILNEETELFLSIGSLWEMAIKIGLGKLRTPRPFDAFVNDQMKQNIIELLPLKLEHLEEYIQLPFHHRDPFDRLMIAQAKAERLTILTRDSEFQHYDILIAW